MMKNDKKKKSKPITDKTLFVPAPEVLGFVERDLAAAYPVTVCLRGFRTEASYQLDAPDDILNLLPLVEDYTVTCLSKGKRGTYMDIRPGDGMKVGLEVLPACRHMTEISRKEVNDLCNYLLYPDCFGPDGEALAKIGGMLCH